MNDEMIVDGRYRVLSRIGSGGMADVYCAEDLQLGRKIAVKVLYHRFAEDQEFVERFRREASSAAGLAHPNVVSVFDRGEWDGTYYIAMEYLPGRSLKTIVREHGALDPALAISITIQILRAARFAHQRGIIHRDIKPHNVIVDDEGRVKVTDFGIARAGASDMTQTGSIMGTAQYLSPEQAQGLAVSAASDLYSVGTVLYEMLTGAVPFDGETAVTIALKHVSTEPVSPSALNPAVSPALDTIVLRAMAKDPAARFANADEFIAALEDAQRSLTVDSGATAPFAAAAVAAAAGVLALPPSNGAAAVDAGGASEPEQQPESEEERRRRRRRIGLIAAAVAVLVAASVAAVLLLHKGRVVVPTVTGRPSAAAIAEMTHAGLRPQSTPVSSATVTIGLVVSQTPAGGTVVDKGSTVTIAVSSGPGSAAVPDVTGLGRNNAIRLLRSSGFRASLLPQPSTTVPDRRVISTDPPAGTETQQGSTVVVVVSSGPAPVTVPDVVGQSLADASALLTVQGLQVTTVPQSAAGQTPGTVLTQSPPPGTAEPRGFTVSLVVAKAPQPSQNAKVPGVVGQGEAQAAAALGAAGFSVNTVNQTVTDPASNGIVRAQSPSAGQTAKRGSTVTIKIGVLKQIGPTGPTGAT